VFRRMALCLYSVVFVSSSFAQLITTEVGADWLLSTGGGSATATPLGQLFGVATDAKGNIYFADYDNHKVMSLQPGGTLTVIAGNGYPSFSGDGGLAVNASLQFPQGVAVGPDGTVYIADTGNDRIRQVTPAGLITTYAGNGSETFSGDGGMATAASLFAPNSVAVDSAGNLYIADTRHSCIRKVATTGIITTVAGNGVAGYAGDNVAATSTSLNEPYGIAVDSAGNLFIADTFNNRIRKVAVNGTIATLAGTGVPGYADGAAASAQFSFPKQLVLDSKGNVFVADPGNNLIRKITGATTSTVAGNFLRAFSGDGGAALSASLGNPSSVAMDAAGDIFIADTQNGRIRMVNAINGSIQTVAGNGGFRNSPNGALAPDAFLNNPQDVKIGPNDLLYIVDSQNERILRVNADNTTTTVAGNHQYGFSGDGGAATSATLYDPRQMAFDSAGNFYIADSQNLRIRKVSAAGVITTFAGNGNAGYSGDGGVAASAALNYPTGVACDSAGNVYIADQLNNVVRKVAPNGAISTFAGTGTAGYNGDGIPAIQAALSEPERLFVDSNNRLYIADIYNHRVRMVTSDGIIHTVAGTGVAGYAGDGGLATQAELNSPAGVAVDSQGNVYIADTGNGAVRMVNTSGVISTVAGAGQEGFSGDGGFATQATLNGPRSMVPDNGALHIADTNNNRIRKVFQSSSSISSQATPNALTFSALSGAGPAAAQTVALSAAISGLGFSVSADSPWISITPSSGSVPALIQVTADATDLGPGAYQGKVIVTTPNAMPATAAVNVTFQVGAATAPKLGTSAPSVGISAPQGSPPVTQSLQILNTGGGSLPFTATIASSGGSWLSVSPLTGTATASAPVSLAVTATPGTLAAGTYSGVITIAAAGSTSTVPVTLSISAPSGTLLISQSAITFNAVSQGGVALPQNFSILNTGLGSLDWRASASTLSGGNWLQLSPSSGTLQQPLLSYSTVSVTVNPASLTPGTYYGSVQISSSGAVNSPQILTVILNVLAPGTNLGPQIYPNGLIFTGIAGASPGSQTIMVGNTGTSPESYLSGVIGPVALLPSNATIQPSQPAMLVVQPDFTNLGAGISRGTITLQFSDGSSSQAVNILMSVAPSPSPQASSPAPAGADRPKLEPRATSCPPAALQVIFRLPQPFPNFSVTAGQSMSIEAAISDACGNAVAPGAQQPQIFVNFGNGDPQQSMTYLGNGVWQTAWRPVNTAPSVTVAVTAVILVGSTLVGGQAKVSGAVIPPSAAGSTPIVTAQGVVHAASDVGGIPIAPGELITVYGSNLASGTVGNSGLPLPLSSEATQVFLGAQPLPILYTSSGQMNVQVPYSAPVNTTFQLLVQNSSTLSVPQTLDLAQASPGIFTTNEQGFGQGAILKSDGVTLAQPGTPASIGETITIYCTGLGATTPPATEGQPAPSSTLARTENTTTVMIGGQPAQVQFSGLTPGFAGLYQVNAVVPSGIATGDTVPVTITVAGQTSQAGVTMSVH
jgi:uncharacterized protein (TIGR03437 family)